LNKDFLVKDGELCLAESDSPPLRVGLPRWRAPWVDIPHCMGNLLKPSCMAVRFPDQCPFGKKPHRGFRCGLQVILFITLWQAEIHQPARTGVAHPDSTRRINGYAHRQAEALGIQVVISPTVQEGAL
jgi:hypothetical protein